MQFMVSYSHKKVSGFDPGPRPILGLGPQVIIPNHHPDRIYRGWARSKSGFNYQTVLCLAQGVPVRVAVETEYLFTFPLETIPRSNKSHTHNVIP